MSDWQWAIVGLILGWLLSEVTQYFYWKRKGGKK